MKIKTADLINEPLNYAVAIAQRTVVRCVNGRVYCGRNEDEGTARFSPSANVVQAYPIIFREKISLGGGETFAPDWYACYGDITEDSLGEVGPTPLIAAMRVFVAHKLGDEVDVPEELL